MEQIRRKGDSEVCWRIKKEELEGKKLKLVKETSKELKKGK